MFKKYNLPKALMWIGASFVILLVLVYPNQGAPPRSNEDTFDEGPNRTTTSTRIPPEIEEVLDTLFEPNVVNATEPHSATVIFLHDWGETAAWWAENIEPLIQPYMKLICPNSHILEIKERDENIMSSWYQFDGRRHIKSKNRSEDYVLKSVKIVHDLIDKEIKNGIPANRIVVGGIAQGAAMAVHAALIYPQRLAGIVTMTTWYPIEKSFAMPLDVHKDIPVYQGHTEGDPNTSDDAQSSMHEYLNDVTKNLDYKFYRTTTASREKEDVQEFLKKHLAPIPLKLHG